MKRSSIAYLALGLASAWPVAAADYDPLDVRRWPNVVAAPDSSRFSIDQGLRYASAGQDLAFAIYRPVAAVRPPVVILVNGIGDPPGDSLMDWGIYRSWGALFAANGIAAVTMAARPGDSEQNLADLVAYLGANAARLGIDANHIAIFSSSANTVAASHYLATPQGRASVDAAVFYYGLTDVSYAPASVPVLAVVAEGDLRSSQAANYNALWQQVLESKLPWTLVFAATQPHAFDALDATPESRRIVAQTLDFVRTSLSTIAADPSGDPAERALLATLYRNDSGAAIAALRDYVARNPQSTRAREELSRRLAGTGQFGEAEAMRPTAPSMASDPTEAVSSPGEGPALIDMSKTMLAKGETDEAYRLARRAVEGGYNDLAAVGQMGLAALAAGHVDVAISAFEKAVELPTARGASYYNLACAYAIKGDKAAAFDALRKAYANGYRNPNIGGDTDLASLRDDPRWPPIAAQLREDTTR